MIRHRSRFLRTLVVATLLLAGCSRDGGSGPEVLGPSDPPSRAFGTHGGYVTTGVSFPTTAAADGLDEATAAFYDRWKARYLEPGCRAGEYRVKTSSSTDAYSVSEGHAYGMLIVALMAGHDPDGQQLFNRLFAYFKSHPSANNAGLMAWAQNEDCDDVMGVDSATDGDLDIAYALLLADQQWGSAGAVDYQGEAEALMGASLASEIHPANSILVGDWAADSLEPEYDGTRPSDFMPDHFKAFADASGIARWNDVGDKEYAMVAYLQSNASLATGLLPDFVVGAPGPTPAPAPPNWLEDDTDGAFAYNACRTPWRLATDYLVTGDPRARDAVRRMNTWIRSATGDDPSAVVDGYALDGTPLGSHPELAFVAPFAVGAMVDPDTGTNGPWLDALWIATTATTETTEYYGDSVKLLGMIVLSDNWFMP